MHFSIFMQPCLAQPGDYKRPLLLCTHPNCTEFHYMHVIVIIMCMCIYSIFMQPRFAQPGDYKHPLLLCNYPNCTEFHYTMCMYFYDLTRTIHPTAITFLEAHCIFPYRAVACDVTTVKHCNTFRTLNVIFRALSTSVWQKNGRFYSDI